MVFAWPCSFTAGLQARPVRIRRRHEIFVIKCYYLSRLEGKTMIKAVLFDFDGTLADTRPFFFAIHEQLAEKHGLQKHSREDLEKMRALPLKDRFKKAGVPLKILPRLAREGLSLYGELIDTAVPFPGIPELLETLKKEKNLSLGIVSSNSAGNIQRFLNARNLDVFDLIYAGSNIFGKHRTIRRVIKTLGIAREETVYIGDEIRDIVACKKVPLKIISVSWGYDHVSLLKDGEPDYLVHYPLEILEVLG